MAESTQPPREPRLDSTPIADEPGSDAPQGNVRGESSYQTPIPNEPGEEEEYSRYEGLPIPEEL